MGRKKRSRRRRSRRRRRGGCEKWQFAFPFERKHEDYMNCYRACGEEEECEKANEQRKKDIGNCWINCRRKNVEGRGGTAALFNELTPEEEEEFEEEIEEEMRKLQQEMDEEELEKDMATSEGKPNWGGRRRRKKTRRRRRRRRKRRRRTAKKS